MLNTVPVKLLFFLNIQLLVEKMVNTSKFRLMCEGGYINT